MAGASAVFAFPSAVDISSATGVVSVPALLASLLCLTSFLDNGAFTGTVVPAVGIP